MKHSKAISDNLIVESYKEVSSVESDGEFLIGCFENDGKTGLYVMNFRKTEEDESVLKIVLSQNKLQGVGCRGTCSNGTQ